MPIGASRSGVLGRGLQSATGPIPEGVIFMWDGDITSPPDGWSLCDGNNGTPDLRDEFVVGAGSNKNPGDVGGASAVTLSQSDLASHYHGNGSLSTGSQSNHNHGYDDETDFGSNTICDQSGSDHTVYEDADSGGYLDSTKNTGSAGSHSHNISGSTSSAGGGGSHNNTPSFTALAYIQSNGSAPIPSGAITVWSGVISQIPNGWVLCDGNNNTPDLQDTFVLGAGGNRSVRDTGGSNSVTLSTSQIPSHSHGNGSLSTDSPGDHQHSYYMTDSTVSVTDGSSYWASGKTSSSTNGAGSHSHGVGNSTANAGGNNAHENRPPYYALAYMMMV